MKGKLRRDFFPPRATITWARLIINHPQGQAGGVTTTVKARGKLGTPVTHVKEDSGDEMDTISPQQPLITSTNYNMPVLRPEVRRTAHSLSGLSREGKTRRLVKEKNTT